MNTTQPEALRLADGNDECAKAWLESSDAHKFRKDTAAELRRQHARITELEAQLEAIGAGGVEPLRGATSYESQITMAVRMLVAADHVTQAKVDEAMSLAARFLPPQKSRGTSSFDAADMATAAASGFRDGVASASPVSEPVAWRYRSGSNGNWEDCTKEAHDMVLRAPQRWAGYEAQPLYSHPSPQEGMAVWTKASKQLPPCRDDQDYIGINTAGFAGIFNAVRLIDGNTYCVMETAEELVSIMSDLDIWKPFIRPPIPAAPGPADGESNG